MDFIYHRLCIFLAEMMSFKHFICISHFVSVRIWSFSDPYSIRIQENTDQEKALFNLIYRILSVYQIHVMLLNCPNVMKETIVETIPQLDAML